MTRSTAKALPLAQQKTLLKKKMLVGKLAFSPFPQYLKSLFHKTRDYLVKASIVNNSEYQIWHGTVIYNHIVSDGNEASYQFV